MKPIQLTIQIEFDSEQGVYLNQIMGDVEWTLIDAALRASEGQRRIAADMLGINRTTLVAKLKKLGLLPTRAEYLEKLAEEHGYPRSRKLEVVT